MKLTGNDLNDNEEMSADALSIRGYSHYRCDDYHLGEYNCLLHLLWSFSFASKSANTKCVQQLSLFSSK